MISQLLLKCKFLATQMKMKQTEILVLKLRINIYVYQRVTVKLRRLSYK